MIKFIDGETWEDYEIRCKTYSDSSKQFLMIIANKEREHMRNGRNANFNDNIGLKHSVYHQNAQMQEIGSTKYMYGDSMAPHNGFAATSAYQFPDGDPFVPQGTAPKASEDFSAHTPDVHDDSMASHNGFNSVGQYQFPDGEPFVTREGSSRKPGCLPGLGSPTHQQELAGCKRKRLENLPRVSDYDQPTGGNNVFKINEQMSFNEESWQAQTVNKPDFSSQSRHSAQCVPNSQVRDTDVIEISDDEQPVSRTKRHRIDENSVGPFHAREYQPIKSPIWGPRPQIHRNVPQTIVSSGRSDRQQTGSTIQRRKRQVTPADPNRGLASFGHNMEPNISSSFGHVQLGQSNFQATDARVQAGRNINMHPINYSVPMTRPALVERDKPRQQQICPSNQVDNSSSDTDSRGFYPYRAQKHQSNLPINRHMFRTHRAEGSHSTLSPSFPYTPNSFVQNNPRWSSLENPNNARLSPSDSRPPSRQRLCGPQGPYPGSHQSNASGSQPASRQRASTLQGPYSRPGQPITPLSDYIEQHTLNLQGVGMSKRKREDVGDPGLGMENAPMAAKRQRPLSPTISYNFPEYTQATRPNHRPISPRLSHQASGTTNSRGHIGRSGGNTGHNAPQNGKFQGNGGFSDYGESQEHWNSKGNGKLQDQHGLDDSPIVIGDDPESVWEASADFAPASRYSGQTCQPHMITPCRAQTTCSVGPISQNDSRGLSNHQPQTRPLSRVSTPQVNQLSLSGLTQPRSPSRNMNTSVHTRRPPKPHVDPSLGHPSAYGNGPRNQPGCAYPPSPHGPSMTFSDQILSQSQLPQSFQCPPNHQHSRPGYSYEEGVVYQHKESSEGQHYQMGYGYPEGTPYQRQDYVAATTLASSPREAPQERNQASINSFDYTVQESLPVYDPPIITSSVVDQFNADVSNSRSPVVTPPDLHIDAVDSPFASPLVVDTPLVLPPVVTPPATTPLAIQPDVTEPEVAEPGIAEPDIVGSAVVKPYSAEEPDDFHPSVASPLVDSTSQAEASEVEDSGRTTLYGQSIKSTRFVPWCKEDLRYVTPYLDSEKAEIAKALKFTRRHYFNIVGEDPSQTSHDLSYASQWGEMQTALADRWVGSAPVPTLFSFKAWDWNFSSWLHPHTERVNGRLRYSDKFYAGMDLSIDAFRYYGEPYESEWAKELQEDLGSRNPIKDPWGLWNHVESYSRSDEYDVEALDTGEVGEKPPDDKEFHGFVETESVRSHTGDGDAMPDYNKEPKPEEGQRETSDAESGKSSNNPGNGTSSAIPDPKPLTG